MPTCTSCLCLLIKESLRSGASLKPGSQRSKNKEGGIGNTVGLYLRGIHYMEIIDPLSTLIHPTTDKIKGKY